jgi:hypothetical protein
MEGKSSADNNKKLPSLSPQDVKQAANDVQKSLEEGMIMTSSDSSATRQGIPNNPANSDSKGRIESFTKNQKDEKKITQSNKKDLVQEDQRIKENEVLKDKQNKKLQQESLISREKATDDIVKKNIDGDYHIRTMQHDIDESKGKEVSVVNISRQSIEEHGQIKDSLNQADFEQQGTAGNEMDRKENLSQEGKIGDVGRKKTHKKQNSFLDNIKNIINKSHRSSRKMTRRKFNFIIAFFIFIFIVGIGYYLYSSGSLSSLSGIGKSFKSLIGWRDEDQQGTIEVATSSVDTTDATTTSDYSDLPVTPTSTASTSTTVSIDESKVVLTPAFFKPDQTKILALNNLNNLFEVLQEESLVDIEDNTFKRIGVIAQDNLGSFSLAKAWEILKSLAQGENNHYTELISGEIIDNWGLAMPGNVYRQISEKYNLFLFGQPIHSGSRAVLIFKIKDTIELQERISLWEITMLSDLKKLFLGNEYGEAATELFQDNIYKDVHIRYLNLPQSNIALDYAIIPDFNYFILSTSRESTWRTIDKIIEAEGPVEKQNQKAQEKGELYLNEDIGFQLYYPEEKIITEERNQEEGVLFSLLDSQCDVTNDPECPIFMWITSIYSAQEHNNLTEITLKELIKEEFGLEEFREFNVDFEQSAQTNYVDVIEDFIINDDITGYFLHNWVQSIGECHYFAKSGSRTLDIIRSGPDLDKSNCKNDELFNQILETVKFND